MRPAYPADPPRRTGKPSTGRRSTGDGTFDGREVCECRTPKRSWMSSVNAAGAACQLKGSIDSLFNPSCICWPTADLLQQRSDDARTWRGNRGRHDDGLDRRDHRRGASRALPISARPAPLHSQEGWEAAAAGSAVMVGQAAGRSDPPAVGGVSRAAVLRALTRLPARPGLPHRLGRGGQDLDRDQLVYRG